MRANTLSAYQLMHDGILALGRAEAQGMRIDVDYCRKKQAHLTRRIERAERELRATKFFHHWQHSCGGKSVNIMSDAQLSRFLYTTKKLKPPKTTESGAGSVDTEALQQLNIPELAQIISIRKLRKVRDTYLDAFVREQINGVLHPFFNLHTTRTYRSSSDSPNFQNIPKRDEESMQICRRAILPRPGHQLLEVDYSGIEVRVSQCYHRDPTMERYIKDPTTDMHGDMAAQLFVIDQWDRRVPEYKVLRNAAKNGFVFPQFYGDYYANCAENMACRWGKLPKEGRWKSGQGLPMPGGVHLSDHLIAQGLRSYQAFEAHVKAVERDFWGKRFRIYQQWKDDWWARYQRTGVLEMLSGFRCVEILSRNEAINRPIQGSAFHCLLWAFIELDRIQRQHKWRSRLIGQIHDAIVVDVHPEELNDVIATMRDVMCEQLPRAWPWIVVPLEVEFDLCPVDGAWSEKQEYHP